jgi:endonuclease/exonuclease/phosphatase family metal-dependent hydrolase
MAKGGQGGKAAKKSKSGKAIQRRPMGWLGWGSGLFLIPGQLGVMAAEVATRVSPVDFPYLAPFGLVYPWALLLLLLGMMWRLIQGRFAGLVVPLVVCIITWSHVRLTWGGSGSETDAIQGGHTVLDVQMDDSLEVMSWNVRQFDRFGWLGGEEVRDEILQTLERAQPQILCIQECFLEEGDQAYLTLDQLKKRTGLNHAHTEWGHERGKNQRMGLVTLSRYPVVGMVHIQFENDRDNAALATDLRVGDDTIRVINAHLSSIRLDQQDYEAVRRGPDAGERAKLWRRLRTAWEKRALQAEKLAEFIQASPHPVIVCGDFNDTPVSYAMSKFRRYVVDAFATHGSGLGGTYIGDLPSLRIDFIMHSPALEAVRFEKVGARLSDHHAVRTRLVQRKGTGEP